MKADVNDHEFQEAVITKVRESSDGYELTHDGWTLYCLRVDGLPAPQVGETLRWYGRGLGYPVRGIVVAGRVYRYQTAAQEEACHAAWCQEQEAKREQELETNLVDTERRIAALPIVFRERMAKFQRDGGHDFRRDYEPYELFCCEQAVVIAEALQTSKAIIAFHAASWEEQKRLVSGLSNEHSGNTFGTACMLARAYVERPEFVAKLHGALTPLVGCEAYGCKHPTADAEV